MTTSPRPRPDLAPQPGAKSQGDLAPTPLPLRGGAKSPGELDTPVENHTTSPQGRSHEPTVVPGLGWLPEPALDSEGGSTS